MRKLRGWNPCGRLQKNGAKDASPGAVFLFAKSLFVRKEWLCRLIADSLLIQIGKGQHLYKTDDKTHNLWYSNK